jgi:hypothetical protein
VILNADIRRYAAALIESGAAAGPFAGPEAFPFPKKGDGLRTLSILDPLADAVYLAAVWYTAPAADLQLGPGVYSHRLSPTWHAPTEPFGVALGRMKRELITEHQGGLPVAVKTDFEDFYTWVSSAVVANFLDGLDAPSVAVANVMTTLSSSQPICRGLPQGSLASDLIANGVLHTMDDALAAAFPDAFLTRYVDDGMALFPDESAVPDFLEAFDWLAAGLGLWRNTEKTKVLGGVSVLAEIRDALREMVKYHASLGTSVGIDLAFFVEERLAKASGVWQSDAAWAVRRATVDRDPLLTRFVLEHADELGFAGAYAGDYLKAVGVGREDADELLDAVGQPFSGRFEATRLQFLRFLVSAALGGSAEGRMLGGLVLNSSMPGPTRSWGAFAASRIGDVRVRNELVDALGAGVLPVSVARGVVVGAFVREKTVARNIKRASWRQWDDLKPLIKYLEDVGSVPASCL